MTNVDKYKRRVVEHQLARVNGPLSQEQEGEYTGEQAEIWEQMTGAEQEEVERWAILRAASDANEAD